MQKVFTQLRLYAGLVKFSHTVFALPFALSMLVVLARTHPVSWSQIVWILVALVSARTAAMAFNRLIDRDVDARNPRTREREIPSGKLSVAKVRGLLFISSAVFLGSAAVLGLHCLVLAPFVLGILLLYSWTKRFTSSSHIVLGLSLALAPGGVWYALTAEVALLPVLLMAAVLFWVAGFDILYSCQDVNFDTEQHLFSIPVRCGVATAFWLARLFHVIAFVFLGLFGVEATLGIHYFAGLLVFGLILGSQHLIISPKDLSRIDAAFFTRNGTASLVFFLAVILG